MRQDLCVFEPHLFQGKRYLVFISPKTVLLGIKKSLPDISYTLTDLLDVKLLLENLGNNLKKVFLTVSMYFFQHLI